MHERSDARKSRLEREATAAAEHRARVMAARIEAFAEEMALRDALARNQGTA
ncbi:hypothetical protein NOK12_17000 [Nocardioides sp. OK12]|uniref:hypothetical protein n=1 Tax=Nocardioides sp. OK12 TaxID=2758661 RepID=UPI0021C2B36B|nr:hypothetical protein [Nocardioides sp. OK12]GHJ59182.1 hypothetical protein NOK12_17000 [Nocardioides sp. OK12]